MTAPPTRVAVQLGAILEAAGIPHALGGSLASTVHGEPRTTADVDFAIQLQAAQVTDLVERLETAFFVQAATEQMAVDHQDSFNAIHRETMIKADIYVRPPEGIFASEIERAVTTAIDEGGGTISLATAEDTLLQKLRWFRSGGDVSERQWRDVLGIAKTQGTGLDLDCIRLWATRLELTDLVDRLLIECDLSS